MKDHCPRCSSEDIKFASYLGKQFLVCNKCQYDERELYDVFPEERTSQKAKKEFSPYKSGGAKRTVKK